MRQRKMLSPVLLSASLLLAPAAWAQQEVIDPQPEPGTESQPTPPASEVSLCTAFLSLPGRMGSSGSISIPRSTSLSSPAPLEAALRHSSPFGQLSIASVNNAAR